LSDYATSDKILSTKMQKGRNGHAGQRSGKSPKGKGPFQKIKKPDLRPKVVPISKRIRDVTRLLNKVCNFELTLNIHIL